MELSESFSFFYMGLKDSNLELGSPNLRSTQTHDLRQENSQFDDEVMRTASYIFQATFQALNPEVLDKK
jgi:hypothetical protein